ncbi:MAG: ATP-binding protein [Longimicrobiales bacterium]
MSLRPALFLVMALVVAAALTAAGLVTSRQLESALLARTEADLTSAGMLLSDRWQATAGMRMMHAKELAEAPGLAAAVMAGNARSATEQLATAAGAWGESAVLVDGDGAPVVDGMAVPLELVEATKAGEMPVTVVEAEGELHLLALAPVKMEGEWVAAAGGATPFDGSEAGTLAGLTHTGVSFVVDGPDTPVATTTLTDSVAVAIASAMMEEPLDSVASIDVDGEEYFALAGQFQPDLRIVFARSLEQELAVLPELQLSALVAGAGALGVALLAAALFSGWVSMPVGSLASAADRLAAGDFEAPVPQSGLTEVSRMAHAFDSMRAALTRRLDELQEANTALEDRQERLALLQAELVQRERAASAGQLASQLAHEIRNPIASVRNCLEVLKRRSAGDEESIRFADLAIDELLRMHELAEEMLGLQRPRLTEEVSCDLSKVAHEVGALADAGSAQDDAGRVAVIGGASTPAQLPSDALKQVLLNLVLNAREARPGTPVEIVISDDSDGSGSATIEVLDRGPGISDENMDRIFDPFFSTKDKVRGVGLGLFMADAMIRSYRGSIRAENRLDGPGARFMIEVPVEAQA